MYYYGYNNAGFGGCGMPCCGCGGHCGGFGSYPAIILVLFILLVIVIGSRFAI